MDIDREKLRMLASDPQGTIKTICAGLGCADPTLYLEFRKDPSLRKIYDDAREAGAAAGGPKPRSHPTSAKASRKYKQRKSTKAASVVPPPGNGRAKHGLDPDLVKQLVAEFHFIDAWGEVSDHFDELRDKVVALR